MVAGWSTWVYGSSSSWDWLETDLGRKNSNSRVEISHCLWSPQKFSVFYSMCSVCIGLRSLIHMELYPEKLPGNAVCWLVLGERSIMTHEVPPPATRVAIFHKAVIHNSDRMVSAQQPGKNEGDTCMECWAMFPLQKLYWWQFLIFVSHMIIYNIF